MPKKSNCAYPHTAWPWECNCAPPFIPCRAHRVYEEADEPLRLALTTFYEAKYASIRAQTGATISFPVDFLSIFDNGSDLISYKKNMLAFYRLLDSGAFVGHEDQWVVIENEQIKQFYDSKPKDIYRSYESGIIMPVDARNTPVTRK